MLYTNGKKVKGLELCIAIQQSVQNLMEHKLASDLLGLGEA